MKDFAKHKDPSQVATAFLSRAQAAFALTVLTDVDDTTAAMHVCDGSDDNGIDAIYYSEEDLVLYIVQSKWHESGSGTIEMGEAHKLLSGFKELLTADRTKFNEKFAPIWPSIEKALGSVSKIVLCIAHTGSGSLNATILQKIASDLMAINDTSDLVSFRTLNQGDLHAAIALGASGAPVDFDLMLLDWGAIAEPFIAFYGRVAATDVARWMRRHGRRLLAKNIRGVIQDSNVNDKIFDTLKGTPEQFWYFNNGITVLCQDIQRKPLGASDRAQGVFAVRGASIVNGAQTAGAIARAIAGDDERSNAMVHARFISLANCPPEFATEVTRATNTQNRIENRDFAALDPVHERLRSELLIDGKEYLYKTGDKATDLSKQCTIDDVTIALACADDDVATSTIAKNSIGKLWENLETAPYKKLFNEGLSIYRLWNAVEVMRSIDASLKSAGTKKTDKNIAVHGNRFLAHRVFLQIGPAINNKDYKVDAAQVAEMVREALENTADVIATEYPSAYIGVIFKNQQRCRAIDAALK